MSDRNVEEEIKAVFERAKERDRPPRLDRSDMKVKLPLIPPEPIRKENT